MFDSNIIPTLFYKYFPFATFLLIKLWVFVLLLLPYIHLLTCFGIWQLVPFEIWMENKNIGIFATKITIFSFVIVKKTVFMKWLDLDVVSFPAEPLTKWIISISIQQIHIEIGKKGKKFFYIIEIRHIYSKWINKRIEKKTFRFVPLILLYFLLFFLLFCIVLYKFRLFIAKRKIENTKLYFVRQKAKKRWKVNGEIHNFLPSA